MKKPIISGDTITIPSSQEYLTDVDVFIEGILRGYGADESVIADVAISVSELVNNAILHGNRSSDVKTVKVTIARNSKDISITVVDEGQGFNPDDIEDPLADENLLKEAGRGIFIVRSLMDDVDIYEDNGGTAIKITKSIG
ncbi:MAG: ATP-binding protein [Candidatus Zixiibacteriota bacterium]|nr:MAG: ATP-binding protein [candidate division Zixibacteria bacterium]